MSMIWSPSGPTVAVAGSPIEFVVPAKAGFGGVARVFNNNATAAVSFTLGTSALASNSDAIPVGPLSDLFIAYGPGVTHIFASNEVDLRITPGTARP